MESKLKEEVQIVLTLDLNDINIIQQGLNEVKLGIGFITTLKIRDQISKQFPINPESEISIEK